MKNCEIITIGDELLIGQVVNTNAAWMGRVLNENGFTVDRVLSIADKKKAIIQGIEQALHRAEVVLLTGGLGPTKDDITKEALCTYFDTVLVENPQVQAANEALFAKRGYLMTEINRKQSWVPAVCEVLYNSCGTAPGMYFEKNGKILISMPGVPYEMKAMMEKAVLPRLRAFDSGNFIRHQSVMTQGIGESFLSDKIAEWEDALPENFSLAYLPEPGIVRLRITANDSDEQRLQQRMELEVSKLKNYIAEYIYSYQDQPIEETLFELLKEKKKTLATAESCTGGYIAHLISSLAGSSAVYRGSIIAYHNEVKQNLLGIPKEVLEKDGAVSETCVLMMAEHARRILGSDYALAVSGIAGPTGGTQAKPIGTVWIALASAKGVQAKVFHFGDNRERNIRRTAIAALHMLLKEL